MPRKQLLVLGFRNWGQVAKQLQQQKAARLVAIKNLHTGVHKAAVHKATAQQSASQVQKGTATRQDASGRPSFAASAFVARPSPPAASSSPGVFGRLLNRLRPSPPTHTSQAMPSAPSFAAAPLLRGQQQQQPGPSAPPRANTVLATAERLAAQASAKPASPAPTSPLYRFARMGKQASAEAVAGQEGSKGSLGALKKYAELPGQLGQQQGTVSGPVKKVAQRTLDAKALLRYAKLK